METKQVDVYLGSLDQKHFTTMLLNLAGGSEDGMSEIIQDDVEQAEYTVRGTYEYTWEGDPATTLPSGRRLVCVCIN
jgi:hypothetical protein